MEGKYAAALSLATQAALEAGARLSAELHRPGGPAGQGGSAPIDSEVERFLCERLTGATPYSFLGEETGARTGADPSHCWIVDPNDGTRAFLRGSRGASVSIGLVRDGAPVLGVIFAYAAPDDDGDLFTWAEGAGPLRRNGAPVPASLSTLGGSAGTSPATPPNPRGEGDLGRYDIAYVSGAADDFAPAVAAAITPVRFFPLPSVAYRLALVAAGEGVVAIALGGPRSWDLAAGHALILAAGGEVVDKAGRPLTYGPLGEGGADACFAGAPVAIRELLRRPWDRPIRRPAIVPGPYPLLQPSTGALVMDAPRLRRAQGCLLGQLAGDALGSLVEFASKAAISAHFPGGVRDLEDGGVWSTVAGQPTDDSEMALMLARSIVASRAYVPGAALEAYVHWYRSRPFDIGNTTRRALSAAALADTSEDRLVAAAAAADAQSQANGSLMRAAPLGIAGAGRPGEAAAWAREDSALTHPHTVCREACAAYVAAIAAGVGGADAAGAYAAAREESARGGCAEVIQALDAAASAPPGDFSRHEGWVLLALQNAFYRLLRAPSLEEGVIATVGEGGDTDTNAAIAGALLGAVHGRDAVPARWRRLVLTCRPMAEAGALQVRPTEFWPVDALLLAEALLSAGR